MCNECLSYCQWTLDVAMAVKVLIDTDSDITVPFCRFNCAAVIPQRGAIFQIFIFAVLKKTVDRVFSYLKF